MDHQQLLSVYAQAKSPLSHYQQLGLTARFDQQGRYELRSEKEGILINGKPKEELYFAGLVVQRSYLGFYFMPIYTEPQMTAQLGPALMNCLKGKSCFHLTQRTPQLKEQYTDALALGYQHYQDN
jgi:hypothetical protein